MTARVRRIGIAAGLALILVGVAHGVLWWWAVSAMEREVTATLANPPAQGWQAGAGPLRRGGWPWAAMVEIPALSAAGPLGAPGEYLRWQAERMTVSLALIRPRTLMVAVIGQQSVQLGAAAPVPFAAERLHAEVPLEPGVPARAIAVEVEQLAAVLPTGRLVVARLDVAAEQRPAAQQGEPAAAVTLSARGVDLPQGHVWPLGPALERVLLDLVVTGPVPRNPDLAGRAEAWRDGGGAVELRKLELAWGEVTLSGGATLALDGKLQPMGAATAKLTGHAAALRALTASGLLTPRSAVAAGAVLSLMARTPAEGGPAVVEVPFSLQNRTLALGRIPLIRLPELVWRPPS